MPGKGHLTGLLTSTGRFVCVCVCEVCVRISVLLCGLCVVSDCVCESDMNVSLSPRRSGYVPTGFLYVPMSLSLAM